MQQDQESSSISEAALAKERGDQEDETLTAAPKSHQQQQQLEQTYLPINKWSTDKCLEWLAKKLQHHLPSSEQSATIARLNKVFASKRITGEVLLELNNDYLEYMSITEGRLK